MSDEVENVIRPVLCKEVTNNRTMQTCLNVSIMCLVLFTLRHYSNYLSSMNYKASL